MGGEVAQVLDGAGPILTEAGRPALSSGNPKKLGPEAVGQRLEPDQAVIECRHPAAFTD
jgi:hypothetical protein